MEPLTEFNQIFDQVYPEQINLKSFNKKDTLCPSIWKDGDLKKFVRRHLYALAKEFMEGLDDNMNIPIRDVLLVGSIAGFNWSKYSDVDLHVTVNFDELSKYGTRETLQSLFDMKKADWNANHDIYVYGYPVEMYIQGDDTKNESDGIYSVKYGKWIKVPSGGSPIMHKQLIKNQAARYINIIDKLVDAADVARSVRQCQALYDELDMIADEVYAGRKSGLAEEGESAAGNIVFKVLRRTGHMDLIKQTKRLLYDKMRQIGGPERD
jgi:hypothetical protein